MPNAFGYARHPQKGTPDPTQVGQALVQQRMQPSFPAVGSADAAMQTDPATMRHLGAKLMGGPGQTELGLSVEQGPSAINSAVGEYLTRVGGGHERLSSPHKPSAEAKRQLMHLGLSEAEAELLILGGGA